MYRVIVQRRNRDRGADRHAETRGGRKLRDLAGNADAFVAELPGRAIANLGRQPSVKWISYDALVRTTGTIDASKLATLYDQTVLATGLWSTATKNDVSGKGVGVAIVDSGIDPTYIDLLTLVDISRAASFADTKGKDPLNPTDDQLIDKFFPGIPLWRDLNGHGTHVASTVSSRSLANAGVTSRVTLIPVKVIGASGSGSFTAILQGLLYATDIGADVINASVGVIFSRRGEGDFTKLLDRVTKYARDAGVTTVVAAGNDAAQLHPSANALYGAFCSTKNVICVSATGPHTSLGADGKPNVNGPTFLPSLDFPSIFTNFGQQHVDVAAPGGNWLENEKGQIVSAVAVWAACSKTSLDFIEPKLPEDAPEGTEPPPGFYQKSVCAQFPLSTFTSGQVGTSMASPHVAGLAALLVEKHGRNPNLILEILRETSDDLGKSGTDEFYGRGRINVARALGLSL
jgi:subtilisin family serine protease